jgi:hypothetical protein
MRGRSEPAVAPDAAASRFFKVQRLTSRRARELYRSRKQAEAQVAFDQVSLFLYPPRWERHSVPDAYLKHYSGEPVRIVSDVRTQENCGPAVPFDALCAWFESKGFEIVVRSTDYAHFCSAPIDATFGRRAEIDASASAEGREVTSLYCRFQLNREGPLRLERWEAFLQELCGQFALRISVSDAESVGPEQFLEVVRRTDNWRHFAEQFGWQEPSE